MPGSELVISQIEGVTMVDIQTGSLLEGGTVEYIARELYALADKQAKRKIVIDFQKVRFLSSTMLGVLVSLQKRLRAIKGNLVIVGLRPELRKIFHIMRLDKILAFADDEQQAITKLATMK